MRYVVSRRLVKLLSLLLFATALGLPSSPAYAWTWNENTYTASDGQITSPPSVFNCGGSADQPCVIWQEPQYTVITANVYLDSTLAGLGTAFGPVLTNTVFPNIQSLPDYAPNYVACYNEFQGGCGFTLGYFGGNLGCGDVFGATAYDTLSGVEYTIRT